MIKQVAALLERCGTEHSVLPPTELFNEGWMLRLVLDWLDRNREAISLPLSMFPGARWYSEALLPSRFLAQRRGDVRAESFTHADGIVGHFSIQPGERGEAVLSPSARQFIVAEAKLGSALSARTKNAPDFDQAARNVACMAHMIHVAHADLKAIERLGFYVIAPETQIGAKVFGTFVTRESIRRKVVARVEQYEGFWGKWVEDVLDPVLERIQLSLLSWEEVLSALPTNEDATAIRAFYAHCLTCNPTRGEQSR